MSFSRGRSPRTTSGRSPDLVVKRSSSLARSPRAAAQPASTTPEPPPQKARARTPSPLRAGIWQSTAGPATTPTSVGDTPRTRFSNSVLAGRPGGVHWPDSAQDTSPPQEQGGDRDSTAEEDWLEWQIALRHLRVGSETLGQGQFGFVKKATWRGTPVAVKLVHDGSMLEDKELFVKELQTMASLHHPNIVQFLGFVLLPDLAIVMELFPERSVQNYGACAPPAAPPRRSY